MVILLRCYQIVHVDGQPKCINSKLIRNFKFPNDHDFRIDYTKPLADVRNQWRRLLLNWKHDNGAALQLRAIDPTVGKDVPVHYNVYMWGTSAGMPRGQANLFPGLDEHGEKLTVAEHGWLKQPTTKSKVR